MKDEQEGSTHNREKDDVTFREPQSFREMAADRRKEVCGR